MVTAISTDSRHYDPTEQTEYTFEDCEWWRNRVPPISWRKLGRRYNRHHETIRDKYYREIIKRKSRRKQQAKDTIRYPVNSGIPQSVTEVTDTGEHTDKLEYHSRITLKEVRRLPYGKLEPTGYISDLSHIDWMRRYYGHTRYRWDYPYLTSLQDLMWSGDDEIGHFPRFGGKTATYLGVAPRIIVERLEPVMTVCSPKRVGVLFRGMHNRMVKSPLLRKEYGDILAVEEGRVQSNRTESMMWIHDDIKFPYDDPLFRVASRETDIIGSHPTWIHFEDISQQESESKTQKIIEWYEDVLTPMLSLEKEVISRKTSTSTRKGMEDFDNYLMTKQSWTNENSYVKALGGYIPSSSEVTFDDRGRVFSINPEALKKITVYNPNMDICKLVDIAIRTPVSFASQYQNEPIARGGAFFSSEEWIEVDYPVKKLLNTILWIDPAWGKTVGSSDSALIVTTTWNGKLVIMDCSTGKYDPVMLESEAVRLATKWNTAITYAEDNYIQVTSRYTPDSPMRRLRGFMPFYTKTDKLLRIISMKGPFSTRLIEIHTSCSFKDKMKNQFLAFNRLKGSWDILDIMSIAYQDQNQYMMGSSNDRGFELIS